MALFLQVQAVWTNISDVQAAMDVDRVYHRRQYQTLNCNLRPISIIPGKGRSNNNNNNNNIENNNNNYVEEGAPPAASLSPTPRMLYLLWLEWTTGIGGRKAASLFTAEEKGEKKCGFCSRKVVWDCVASLVKTGLSSHVAIDQIYKVYGLNATVTEIINQMRTDRNSDSLHPLIRTWKLQFSWKKRYILSACMVTTFFLV